ncbi:hypothetical protein [Serratia fonticola]|uniref:hypothetical protein n=1 Tax=Serratia fonticola TaxID=47917 RepID=UPI001377881C|nr:hypothetical protein [Serratia fonticola]NCG51960.1 hypothetical protein [Serratia fonticola]
MAKRLTFAARKAVMATLVLSMPWSAAQALIDIQPKVAQMRGESLPISVINTGDTPEFVEIKLYLVANPGVPPNQEQLTPLGIVKDPYLYAAPFRLSLGPRQQKQIELTALKQPEKEMVYRLSVMPQQQARINGTQSNVMLMGLGYMGLVRQLPAVQTATWRHQCAADGLLLEATGTVRVEFTNLRQHGEPSDDFNVYPGTPRQIAGKTLSGKAQGNDFTLQCKG